MNPLFQIRTGKHAGRTIAWLQQHEPSYITWIQENRPEMLKGSDVKKPEPKKEVTVTEIPTKSMVPNLNFYNEGPDEISKPYLKKMEEEKNKKPDLDLDMLF